MSGALLALIALCYAAPGVFQAFGGDAAWLFYIARSLTGVFLFYFLGKKQGGMTAYLCLFGMICEALTAGCGVAYWIQPVYMEPWQQLCDAKTGLPVSSVVLVALVLLAALVHQGRKK